MAVAWDIPAVPWRTQQEPEGPGATMESDTMTALVPPAGPQSASVVSAPTLNYARPRRFARLRRWIGPSSPLFFLLILALAGAGTRGVWKWRLKADEKAFNERTY